MQFNIWYSANKVKLISFNLKLTAKILTAIIKNLKTCANFSFLAVPDPQFNSSVSNSVSMHAKYQGLINKNPPALSIVKKFCRRQNNKNNLISCQPFVVKQFCLVSVKLFTNYCSNKIIEILSYSYILAKFLYTLYHCLKLL